MDKPKLPAMHLYGGVFENLLEKRRCFKDHFLTCSSIDKIPLCSHRRVRQVSCLCQSALSCFIVSRVLILSQAFVNRNLFPGSLRVGAVPEFIAFSCARDSVQGKGVTSCYTRAVHLQAGICRASICLRVC